MPYDLFISYARRDDERQRISTLVERLSRDFHLLAGRPLNVFFDAVEIHGMEDWRHRILQALRESRLLLACISPNYLASQYYHPEVATYLNNLAQSLQDTNRLKEAEPLMRRALAIDEQSFDPTNATTQQRVTA